ncbi:hypothetical protein ACT3SZ_15000 [Corynebacterium sp. AOP40-9SA-29]|uniref:hypothetical protein n=1 Tax=Corynebacterium sp. AOP40-9SA-29 TaxID=3457677 RepID=UPI0040343C3B
MTSQVDYRKRAKTAFELSSTTLTTVLVSMLVFPYGETFSRAAWVVAVIFTLAIIPGVMSFVMILYLVLTADGRRILVPRERYWIKFTLVSQVTVIILGAVLIRHLGDLDIWIVGTGLTVLFLMTSFWTNRIIVLDSDVRDDTPRRRRSMTDITAIAQED